MRHRRIPRTTPAVPPSFRPWPAIALLIVSSCVDVAWGCSLTPIPESRTEALDRVIRTLTGGSQAERLAASHEIPSLVRSATDGSDEEDDPIRMLAAEAILDTIETEPDDFVVWTILDELTYDDGKAVTRVMRAALRADSPNVRSVAVRWFAHHVDIELDSILEDLWHGGVPEWARVDLMAALAKQGSSTHLADFIDLTRDDDPAVRIAAIEALQDLGDDGALPRLIELARTGDRHEREPALEAIGEWTQSDAAFAAILDTSRDGDSLKQSALRLLGGFHRLEGDERLIEALAEPGDVMSRLTAALSLETSTHPAATDSILRLLTDAEIRGEEWGLSTILGLLRERDDAAALPDLEALLGAGRIEPSEELTDLMTFLGREDRSEPWSTTTTISTSCGFRVLDPDDPDVWHVVAPAGRRSVRCSQGPAMTGETWFEPRVQDGSLVTIERRFDRQDEPWAFLDGADSECWVPMSLLERGGGSGMRPLDPWALEIDLPAAALRTASARRLVRKGILEEFDPDEGVVGVVLRPRKGGPSLEAIVASIEDGPVGDAAEQMQELLEALDERSTALPRTPVDSEDEVEEEE